MLDQIPILLPYSISIGKIYPTNFFHVNSNTRPINPRFLQAKCSILLEIMTMNDKDKEDHILGIVKPNRYILNRLGKAKQSAFKMHLEWTYSVYSQLFGPMFPVPSFEGPIFLLAEKLFPTPWKITLPSLCMWIMWDHVRWSCNYYSAILVEWLVKMSHCVLW